MLECRSTLWYLSPDTYVHQMVTQRIIRLIYSTSGMMSGDTDTLMREDRSLSPSSLSGVASRTSFPSEETTDKCDDRLDRLSPTR